MMRRIQNRAAALIFTLLLLGCGGQREKTGEAAQTVVIAVEGDVDSFNPVFAEDITAGAINDLLFPALISPEFDRATGQLFHLPMLARTWLTKNDGRSLEFQLRTDVRWSDGVPVTAGDVRFSYEIYGDPDVGSIRQMAVEQLRKDKNGASDIARSVEVVNDSTVIFHFERRYPGQLFDAGLPVIPAHVFKDIPRKELRNHPVNKTPLSSGPFTLHHWTPMQEVVLVSNMNAPAPSPGKIPKLVFRVLPDYRTRVNQLQSGEVDIVTGLRVEDAGIETKYPSVSVVSAPGRDYDFIGWNNIDPDAYQKSGGKSIRPHKLFGSAVVRRALTMSINRAEIAKAYLGDHGREAFGGVSPLFQWAYNDTMNPLPFNPREAGELLAQEGWRDTDGDGILERGGLKFTFTLKVPSGNQLRSTIGAVIQQQLRGIKINMEIEQVERGTFWKEMMTRRYDAWIAGFSVPLQMQLDDLWGSDLERYPFNLVGFRNQRVDEILDAVKALEREEDGGRLWKEFQVIVQQEQPYTFLFWINNIIGVNKRVEGANLDVLGVTHRAWEWTVRNN